MADWMDRAIAEAQRKHPMPGADDLVISLAQGLHRGWRAWKEARGFVRAMRMHELRYMVEDAAKSAKRFDRSGSSEFGKGVCQAPD